MGDDTNTQRALGRIEGKLGAIHAEMTRGHMRMNEHGKRLSKLEGRMRAVWYIGPVDLALVGTVYLFAYTALLLVAPALLLGGAFFLCLLFAFARDNASGR